MYLIQLRQQISRLINWSAATTGQVLAYNATTKAFEPTSSLTTVWLDKGTKDQATSITTGVELNKRAGVITTVSSTLAAGSSIQFDVTNSFATATSVLMLTTEYANGATGTPIANIRGLWTWSFTVRLQNVHASAALNAVVKIHFAIVA